jgi:hypothetical protein
MRLNPGLRVSALLLLAAVPALLEAQFQEPTKEELQMTSDPKAPGAAAVYLNIQETTDDELHYRTKYVRIKVLQEKGKELATVELPYLRGNTKITDIKGRTIHSDGKVIPLTGKAEDLLIAKKGDLTVNRRVFTLPDVEVGSILEYSFELRWDDEYFSSPRWDLQYPYFVHKEHYAFTPFKAFLNSSQNLRTNHLVNAHGDFLNWIIAWTQLPEGVKLNRDAMGRYSIDLTDIPPIPVEDYMPPVDAFLYHLFFYYTGDSSKGDFWVTEANRWSKEVDHFAEHTKPIKEAVAQLVSASDSEIDKAKKLYKAVQQLDNTDFSRQKSKAEMKQLHIKTPKRAEDTWSQKSGSGDDIALLYLAMLRAAGLTAYDMKVVDREKGIFQPEYLDFDQLDDNVIILNTGGKDIVLDPGQKMCPFQTVHWRHSYAAGIRQSADGRAAGVTPEQLYTNNSVQRLGDVTLDEHGAITGDFRFVMTGQEALYWRQQALLNDEDEVKKRFDRMLEGETPAGVEAHIDHFLALGDPDNQLVAIIKAEGVLGSATSKRLLLPGFFFETRGHRPFVDQERRIEAVDMHYPERITEQVVYHLPAGVRVEGAPQDSQTSWGSNAALTVKVLSEPGKITIYRSLARGFTFVKPDRYQELRGFYQKVAGSDQQQLVLSVTPEQKGN